MNGQVGGVIRVSVPFTYTVRNRDRFREWAGRGRDQSFCALQHHGEGVVGLRVTQVDMGLGAETEVVDVNVKPWDRCLARSLYGGHSGSMMTPSMRWRACVSFIQSWR